MLISFFLSEQMTRPDILFKKGKQFESAFCHHDIWLEGEGSFPGGSVVKNLPANAGDVSLIPGSGRSSGEGSGNPLHYSCLGNPVDRGAWQVTVHGVAKSGTQLSTHTNNNNVYASVCVCVCVYAVMVVTIIEIILNR